MKQLKKVPMQWMHWAAISLIVGCQFFIAWSTPNDFDLHAGIYLEIHEGSRTYTGNPGYHLLLTLSNKLLTLNRDGLMLAGIAWACLAKTATYFLAYKYILSDNSKKFNSALISVGICLAIPLIDPIRILCHKQIMLGLLSPNVLHNPTTILSLPFSILLYAELRKKHTSIIKALIYATLTALIKPAFLLSITPALLLTSLTSLDTFKRSGTTSIGIGLIIIIQYVLIFVFQLGINPGEQSTITISKPFEILAHFTSYTYLPLGLICSLAFPLSIVLHKFDKLIWVNFTIALILAAFVKETGIREFHGNFLWTAHLSLFFLFLESGKVLAQNTTKKPSYILAAHALSGLAYPVWIFVFNTYK